MATIIGFSIHDHLTCECGNRGDLEGFYPCNAAGEYVEPTAELWPDPLYRCDKCGRLYRQERGRIDRGDRVHTGPTWKSPGGLAGTVLWVGRADGEGNIRDHEGQECGVGMVYANTLLALVRWDGEDQNSAHWWPVVMLGKGA